jgi:nucleoside-diphosphate-sugar epimerase
MAKPSVLVTGVSGFTGRYVVELLHGAGYEIHGFGELEKTLQNLASSTVVDITDYQQVVEAVSIIEPDYVVHLAAISFVAHGDISEMYAVNVMGTRNLLQALATLKKPPLKVLLVSSANVYGNSQINDLHECSPLVPENDYAVSKCAMEMMASLWFERLPIIIARPFNYTGVGQTERFLIPKIVAHFAEEKHQIELGNTDVSRDFSDVRYVTECYRALLESGVAGETYNVCSSVSHSLQDIIATLESMAGYVITVDVNPAFVRENEIKRLQGSSAKLDAITERTEKIPFADTLAWMYRDTVAR